MKRAVVNIIITIHTGSDAEGLENNRCIFSKTNIVKAS
jgi:hypothetical protein